LAFPYTTTSAKVKLGYQPPSLFSCYITAIMSAIGCAWLFDQALTSLCSLLESGPDSGFTLHGCLFQYCLWPWLLPYSTCKNNPQIDVDT
jgi:hypothetical protein